MRRVKILLTNDGNFHFNDVDEELYRKLLNEGIPFHEPPATNQIVFSGVNLTKRQNDPKWWKSYLCDAILWAETRYTKCNICHLGCGVNRFLNNAPCGALVEGEYFDLFVHPGIEPGLKSVLHIMMAGCSLDCYFCHKDQRISGSKSKKLPAVKRSEVISLLREGNFNYVAFSGGNPDENMLAILKLLNEMGECNFPIIWETHGCVEMEALSWLSAIVDLFIVTVKFGNDACALKHCGAKNYERWIENCLLFLANSVNGILVRKSKIPNHELCCYPLINEIILDSGIKSFSEVDIYPGFNIDSCINNATIMPIKVRGPIGERIPGKWVATS